MTPPLSPFRRVGDTIVTSGITGRRSGALVGPDLAAQARQVLVTLGEILASNGMTPADVLVTNLYLASIADLPEVNLLYTAYFTPPYPARTTIQCGLGAGVLIELSAVAASSADPG